jgi:hypothetical protein
MRILIAMVGLALLPVVATDLTGNWKLEGDVADAHIDRMCTIKQAENKLSGTCKSKTNETALTGDVNGKKVTWQYQADYQGQKVTVVFDGTLDSNTAIIGTISAEGASGKFTAKKQ